MYSAVIEACARLDGGGVNSTSFSVQHWRGPTQLFITVSGDRIAVKELTRAIKADDFEIVLGGVRYTAVHFEGQSTTTVFPATSNVEAASDGASAKNNTDDLYVGLIGVSTALIVMSVVYLLVFKRKRETARLQTVTVDPKSTGINDRGSVLGDPVKALTGEGPTDHTLISPRFSLGGGDIENDFSEDPVLPMYAESTGSSDDHNAYVYIVDDNDAYVDILDHRDLLDDTDHDYIQVVGDGPGGGHMVLSCRRTAHLNILPTEP